MTAYIAICSDNVADRKHLERLLEREKDARLAKSRDVLYIDSFGSEEALLTTPIKYDIFLLDLSSGDEASLIVTEKLRSRGIAAPVVLFSSAQNYDSYVSSPEDIIYIEKHEININIIILNKRSKKFINKFPNIFMMIAINTCS